MSLGLSVASPLVTTETETEPAAQPIAAQVKEIQELHVQQRRDVLLAPYAEVGAEVPDKEHTVRIIESAMMALVQAWRAEADLLEVAKRRGWKSTCEEIRRSAARLAGFAHGFADSLDDAIPNYAEIGARAAGYEGLAAAKADLEPLDHEPQCACGHPNCAALSLAAAIDAQQEGCSHPADQRSTLKSGAVLCTLCQASLPPTVWDRFANTPQSSPALTADNFLPAEPHVPHHLGDVVTVAGVQFAKIGDSPFGDESEAASVVSELIPNPFTSPGKPSSRPDVKRLGYQDLGQLISVTYPAPRAHLSHSYVETVEKCGLSALLSDASRAGHLGPRRPSWSLIGGTAFHLAIESIERAAISIGGAAPVPDGATGDWAAMWDEALNQAIADAEAQLAGTPYASNSTWHVANRGLEGYDWWRVEGLAMIERYVKHHDDAWRAKHTLLQVPSEPTNANSPRVPVLEFAYATVITPPGGSPITVEGRMDAAWMSLDQAEYPAATLEIVDHKAGKSVPTDPFQLRQYADVLRSTYLPANFGLRIVGRWWLARKGLYTAPIILYPIHGRAEIDYRYRAAQRVMANAAFTPSPSNMCSSCGLVDYCPTQANRDAS